MSKHTELPWVAKPSGGDSWVVMKGGIVLTTLNRRDQPERNKANAEYIVLACNSDDDLVKACKALFLRVTMHYASHQEICKLGDQCPDKKALYIAEAAIAKATGE